MRSLLLGQWPAWASVSEANSLLYLDFGWVAEGFIFAELRGGSRVLGAWKRRGFEPRLSLSLDEYDLDFAA